MTQKSKKSKQDGGETSKLSLEDVKMLGGKLDCDLIQECAWVRLKQNVDSALQENSQGHGEANSSEPPVLKLTIESSSAPVTQ